MPRLAPGLNALTAALVLLSSNVTPPDAQLRSTVRISGLVRPLAFIQEPGNARRQYIVEQDGWIRVVQDGTLQPSFFLDLTSQVSSGGERGLLGLAFAPDYAASGRFWVNFTDRDGHTVIARFRRSDTDPLRADPSSRFDLRWPDGRRVILQPFSNHNGGTIAFGPDGYMYVGMGDGGSGDDPQHLAQRTDRLLGKMLRLNVDVSDGDAEGYDVPGDNPFVDGAPVAALHEIWAFGLRNPWKFSFDDPARGGTGALLIADVGQNDWEEVNYEPAGRGGRNYGWRNREGAHNNVTNLAPAYSPLTEPIAEYPRSEGHSITGGYVYRGQALGAAFRGRYFFADFVFGRVWSIRLIIGSDGEATASDLREHTDELGASGLGTISSFGVDAAGELYVVSYGEGQILQVGSSSPPDAPDPGTDDPGNGNEDPEPDDLPTGPRGRPTPRP